MLLNALCSHHRIPEPVHRPPDLFAVAADALEQPGSVIPRHPQRPRLATGAADSPVEVLSCSVVSGGGIARESMVCDALILPQLSCRRYYSGE